MNTLLLCDGVGPIIISIYYRYFTPSEIIYMHCVMLLLSFAINFSFDYAQKFLIRKS